MKQVNEQTDFEEDLVKKAIIDVFENNFNDNKILTDADELSRKLVDDSMKELFKLKKLFKYAVSVFVQQKNGSAMNFGSAHYYEDLSDGCVTLAFNDDPVVDVMISVIGFKITQK